MQDQTINSLRETLVKDNERIKWSLSENWLDELIKHIDLYLNFSRHKSSSHLSFANNLKELASKFKENRRTNSSNMDTILLSLRDKSGLKELGWNRKQSYLFKLCDMALQLFPYSQLLAQEKEKLAKENAQMILDLKQACSDKDKEIQNLQAQGKEKDKLAEEIYKEVNHWQEKYKNTCDENERQLIQDREKYKRSVIEINSQLKQTKQELSHLQKIFGFFKTWVDQLFGDSLGEKPSEIFEKGKTPKLAENQEQLIRTIIQNQQPNVVETTPSTPAFFK